MEVSMHEYYEVRCPCERCHTVKGLEYERCGTLLGAISEDTDAYFRCPTCGLIHVYTEEHGDIVYEIVGKNKVNFTKSIRRITDER